MSDLIRYVLFNLAQNSTGNAISCSVTDKTISAGIDWS